jgi:hypothetical protein
MESTSGISRSKQAEQTTASTIHIGHLLDYLRRVKDGRKARHPIPIRSHPGTVYN